MSIFSNFFLEPRERLAKRFIATIAECATYVNYIQQKYNVEIARYPMSSLSVDIITFVNNQAGIEMGKHWNYTIGYRRNRKAPFTLPEFDSLISFLEDYEIFEVFRDCYDAHICNTIEQKYSDWVDGLSDIYEAWYDIVVEMDRQNAATNK